MNSSLSSVLVASQLVTEIGMEGSLAGKLTLVTGAGSGIGEALCGILLREGSKVAAVDINPIDPKKYADSKGFCKEFKTDISSQKEVDELLKDVKAYFGVAPDCLVNCAAIFVPTPFLGMTEQQFDDVIRVDLKGAYLISQAVAKALVERQSHEKRIIHGSIVNISSCLALTGFPSSTNYVSAKAGILGLSKTMARELGCHNIRCNSVLPGYILTPMSSINSDEMSKKLIENTTLGRVGKPQEVAEVCAFLLSDKSSFVTGSDIYVTGGLII